MTRPVPPEIPTPGRRHFPLGITVAPDEYHPGRFSIKFRETDSTLYVGDLDLSELASLHQDLAHILAVIPKEPS